MPNYRTLGLALPLLAASLSAPAAMAGQWPKFDHITLTPAGIPPMLVVESENGSSWTKLKPSNFLLSGVVDIKMDKGKVVWFWVKHGNKEIAQSFTGGNKSFKKEVNLPTKTVNLGIAALSAVSACNAKLVTGAEIYKEQYTGITADLELFAAAETGSEKLTRSNFGSFPITVKCLPVPITEDIEQPEPAPPPVADVDDLKPGQKFKVRSAALGIHKPQSNVCPTTAQINARFETNFDGKVTFIYRQAGGGKSAPITVTSKKMPNGKFFAVHNQVVDIKKAMNTKYMVEVVGKGIISDWESLNVPCKIGLGGGGDLAQPPAVPMKVLSAQLGIQGPKTKACPAKAKMTAWFKTNKAGKVGFRLVKKGGQLGPMIFVNAVKAPSGYMATYSKELSIHQPLNTAYSVIIPGGAQSKFVPLKASCSVKLPGGLKSGS